MRMCSFYMSLDLSNWLIDLGVLQAGDIKFLASLYTDKFNIDKSGMMNFWW